MRCLTQFCPSQAPWLVSSNPEDINAIVPSNNCLDKVKIMGRRRLCDLSASVFVFASVIASAAASLDTISTGRPIADGETLVSSEGRFEMGFFSPGASSNRYLGVWYKKPAERMVIWVANRNAPIRDSSGVLKVNESGRLVVADSSSGVVWSSDVSGPVQNPVMQLLDSGNLVVRNGIDEGFLWQSFDHPGNTFLPQMRIGVADGLERYLSSWKSTDDPATGDYTFRFDTNGLETKTHQGAATTYRAGPWSGHQFSGRPYLNPNSAFNYTVFTVVANQKDKYFAYEFVDSSVISVVVLKPNGNMDRYSWADRTSSWMVYMASPSDMCDIYALCGAYSSCDIANSPGCVCLDGFVPASQENWYQSDWSRGCVRQTPLDCRSDGFVKYANLKLPDTRNATVREGATLEACRIMCSTNCYCMAYSSLNRTDGVGTRCFLWYDDIVDIKKFSQYGQDLYVRMASSVVEHENVMKAKAEARSNFNKQISIAAGCAILEAMLLLLLGAYVYRRKKPSKGKALATMRSMNLSSTGENEEVDLPLFDLETVADATDNFSIVNKLGEGGFGSVYKGVLKDGQEIAVKRLSKRSRQGPDEFKNEVVHIARLQHRNLVMLLGCCIDEDEKILIYEFMPNKSLDSFIFDETLLGWPQRFEIVKGIARGLLYLHQDSRFRIIHRDLKLSNVLLDREMNPKISDFGLARSLLVDDETETRAKTRNVVGTYGYMSPEYALAGRYSTKSDVFSFGVMVLEIVSGKSNRGFSHPEHHFNLLGHAWRLYKEGRCLELASSWRTESSVIPEVVRVIQAGLLCVQQSPEERPSMSTVVSMLSGEGALLLPHPKQPGFFSETDLDGLGSSSSCRKRNFSLNGVSTSSLQAR